MPTIQQLVRKGRETLNVTTQTAPGYYVQVGAFGSTENAAKMRDRRGIYGGAVGYIDFESEPFRNIVLDSIPSENFD